MAQRLVLGPIPAEEMTAYLEARAAGAGRPMGPGVALRLAETGGQVRNYIQHLAFEAAGRNGIDDAALDRGLDRAVSQESTSFAEAFSRLSGGQSRVVAALAVDPPEEIFGASFARRVGLASGSSVRKALVPLLANEDVVERDGRYRVADPFYAVWLARSIRG